MNVAHFTIFATCSAFWPATHLNHRCSCATTHGQAMGGWSTMLGRMASRAEFVALGQHCRAEGAVLPGPTNKRRRVRCGRDNGPRGRVDRGRVFQALARSNYPGTVVLDRPGRQGCWG